MNKDLLDQFPAEEQPIASKINSLVENMQPSPAFQWELENQLMDKATITQPVKGWFTKFMVPVGWVIAAIGGVLLLTWTMRSIVPQSSSAGSTATQEVSFADNVRAGNICVGPLAVEHGFAVFLTNQGKTGFVALDARLSIGELRSFTWSADGRQLAIVGNSMGSGNIYLTDPSGSQPQPVLPNGELGYLMDAAWSWDGKQLVAWSSQKNSVVYLIRKDGSSLVEKQLDTIQIFATPQFTPDDENIIFYGADTTSSGLFAVALDNLQPRMISYLVEDESGYAFSPDGSRLAYMEMDRDLGEARLVVEEISTGTRTVLGTLPIPKGSGSSIPEAANLSWAANGESLIFDFGRSPADRAIYLAHADGSELVKIIDAAYAPSISADEKCLAYISDNQVFLRDLARGFSSSANQSPVLLANLPPGRGIPNFKQDKLQWSPE